MAPSVGAQSYRRFMTEPQQRHDGATTELLPDSTGRWLVFTRNTLHILDLDHRTYERVPSSSSGVFDTDSMVHRLTRVDLWPCVGRRMLVWFDDPTHPHLVERWHATSAVQRIEKAQSAEGALD